MTRNGKKKIAAQAPEPTGPVPVWTFYADLKDEQREALKSNVAGNVKIVVQSPAAAPGSSVRQETVGTASWDLLASFFRTAQKAAENQPQPTELVLEGITVAAVRDIVEWARMVVREQNLAPFRMYTYRLTADDVIDLLVAAYMMGVPLEHLRPEGTLLGYMQNTPFVTLVQLTGNTIAMKQTHIARMILGVLKQHFHAMSLSSAVSFYSECQTKQWQRALTVLDDALMEQLNADPVRFSLVNVDYVAHRLGSIQVIREAAERHATRMIGDERGVPGVEKALRCEELLSAPPHARRLVRENLWETKQRRARMARNNRGHTIIGTNHIHHWND